jgi:type IV pilus assembly protein PilB
MGWKEAIEKMTGESTSAADQGVTPDYPERLGDILVAAGAISEEQLAQALAFQRGTSMKLGEILVEYKCITEQALVEALARRYNHPSIERFDINEVDPAIRGLIPERIVRDHLVFPFAREGSVLKVAMVDPTNLYLLDDLRMITGYPEIEIVMATPTIMRGAISDYYDTASTMTDLLGQIDEDDVQVVAEAEETVSAADLRAQIEDTPVIKMVNLIIKEAIRIGATDIHLEPYEHVFRVRYRVDGMLVEAPAPPRKFQGAVISRLKIMADLDIAERRLPQDGRFKLRFATKEVDFRISTLPTPFGEKVVMRILDKSGRVQGKTGTIADLKHLGLASDQIQIMKRNIEKPYGMIIVAGPTGSGKTTTLYSALEILNSPDRNLVTVEDPVEYMIPGINQVAARAQIGLTFAAVLRSILRQDPDVIMIGEIRDKETAEIAVNAALTGHMVLSTLHTNDAPGAVVRFDNMGVEPYLITSTLLLVISQRLMRKICSSCRSPYEPSAELLGALRLAEGEAAPVLYKGMGCAECNGTGYRGRVGVYELMELTEDVKAMILRRATSSEIKATLVTRGFKTLRASSLEVVLAGETTLEEMWRVSTEDFLVGE